jgi:hypothetical protein
MFTMLTLSVTPPRQTVGKQADFRHFLPSVH